MAEPLATVADLEAQYRPLSDVETGIARNALVLASGLVRSSAARVDERIADGTLDATLVQAVVVSCVMRVLRNPEGARQRSETVGPFTTSLTFGDMVATLSLSPSEVALLTPSRTGRVAGIGTMRVGSGYPSGPSVSIPEPIGRHPR